MTTEREDETGEFVLVPREPDDTMIEAGFDAMNDGVEWGKMKSPADIYEAMIKVAPAPTGAGEAEVVDGVLTIKAAAQVQNLLADRLRVVNGEIMGVGPAAYAIARALRRAHPPQQTGSTLSRGQEIEDEFYRLKAQEWAVEPNEAKRLISMSLCKYSGGGARKAKPERSPTGAEDMFNPHCYVEPTGVLDNLNAVDQAGRASLEEKRKAMLHPTGDAEGLVERLRDPRWANYPNTTVGSVQADMEAAAIMIDALNSRSQRLVEALHANMEYTKSLQAILKTRFPNEQVPDAEEALFQKAMLLARAALSTGAGEGK